MKKMNTCKLCEHWRHIRDEDYGDWPGPHGACKIIDDISMDEQPAWTAGTGDSKEDDLSLITQPDFGCSLWGKKEIFKSE